MRGAMQLKNLAVALYRIVSDINNEPLDFTGQ